MASAEEILTQVEEWFCSDQSLEDDFRAFAEKNCGLFKEDNDEHKHEHMDLYKEYCAMFETKLEEFVKSKGISPEQFVAAAQTSEGSSALNILLATSDFDVFVQMMKETAAASSS